MFLKERKLAENDLFTNCFFLEKQLQTIYDISIKYTDRGSFLINSGHWKRSVAQYYYIGTPFHLKKK
jgi:hypothetical protein